ncbi:MAG: response regulator [Deltaproteobacteria bacterium]|nr:response regulator [Deltaproteobacteria bacterium]
MSLTAVSNPPVRSAAKRRVLVAEDDPAIRRMMVAALRADGVEVDEVADGAALIEQLASLLLRSGRRDGYDLLVVDLRMPRMDGLQVLAGLRRGGWRAPVVVVTADPHPGTCERAVRLGARAVFRKPFDLDDFRTAVTHFSRAA